MNYYNYIFKFIIGYIQVLGRTNKWYIQRVKQSSNNEIKPRQQMLLYFVIVMVDTSLGPDRVSVSQYNN